MNPQQTIAVALAFAAAMASPGPGVMAVVSRALAFGWRGNLGFIAGMVVGDLSFIVLAAFGLAALAHAVEPVFVALKYLGAAYLVWLGVRAWLASGGGSDAAPAGKPGQIQGFIGGLILTLANPKTILFYLALLPAVADLSALQIMDVAMLMAIAAAILSSIMLGYSLAAARVRRFFAGGRATRILNRAAGAIMIAVGIAIALRPIT